VLVWVATQVGAAAVYLFLFITHISRIRGGGMDRDAHTGWLRSCFFDAGHDTLLRFIVIHTGSFFAYLFGSRVGGVIGILLFVFGATQLLLRRSRTTGEAEGERCLGLTALLTLALTAAAALAGLFPYGGTRHVAFLSLLVLPAVCFAVASVTRKRVWATLLIAGLAAVGFRALGHPPGPLIRPDDQRRSLMVAAIDELRRDVPQGAPILVDYQTSVVLGYYLRDGGAAPFPSLTTQPDEVQMDGYRVLVWGIWNFDAASFEAALHDLARTGVVREGERMWVVDAGAGPQLNSRARTFGDNIAIFTATAPVPRPTAKTPGPSPT